MPISARLLLRCLQIVEAVLGPLRHRLAERLDAWVDSRLRESYGGFADGSWVRVVAVSCESCQRHLAPGDLVRIGRFTTEAQSLGEWVLSKPRTRFVCAAGVTLEAASEPVAEVAHG